VYGDRFIPNRANMSAAASLFTLRRDEMAENTNPNGGSNTPASSTSTTTTTPTATPTSTTMQQSRANGQFKQCLAARLIDLIDDGDGDGDVTGVASSSVMRSGDGLGGGSGGGGGAGCSEGWRRSLLSTCARRRRRFGRGANGGGCRSAANLVVLVLHIRQRSECN
jgi:hypothetical protein